MPLGTTGESEDDTPRDGFLSYAGEWHSLGVGVYVSLKTWRPTWGTLERGKELHEDVRAEPHYFKLGYLVGTLLQFAAVMLVILLVV